VPAIVADALSVWLVWLLMRTKAHPPLAGRAGYAALALLAAAPASVMISGYHGNTDPVVMCFLLLSVWLWERHRNAWLAGAALGMAINVKVVPLVFLPALFLYVANWRRLAYLAVTGLVVFLGSLPAIVQDPAIVAQKVLGYGSYYGHWGLSRLLMELGAGGGLAAQLDALFLAYGRDVALGAPAVAAVIMNGPHLFVQAVVRRGAGASPLREGRSAGDKPRPYAGVGRPPLYVQCGLIAALFLAVSPGFGVQYLAWLVPWVPAAGALVAAAFYAASGVFLFAVYTYWAGAFPWYTADARPYEFEWWSRPIVNLEVLAWASVLAVLGALATLCAAAVRYRSLHR
jgi:hypothetical protein